MKVQPEQLVALFGRNVKRRRTELGITQEELAERLESVFTYISALERGVKTPWFKNVAKIASALEIEPDALLRPDAELIEELEREARQKPKPKKVVARS